MEKIIIIGSGITGLTAAIYAAREGFSPLVLEANVDGGQFAKSSIIENWPGEMQLDGREFMARLRAQALHNGVRFLNEKVLAVEFSSSRLQITTSDQQLLAAAVIIATGSKPRRLHCSGESEFFGHGLNFSTACDVAQQLNKQVLIVGSGDVAIQTAYLLQNYAAKITLVFLGAEPTATDPLKHKVLSAAKLQLLPQHFVVEVIGKDAAVTAVVVAHQVTGVLQTIACDQVLLAIGHMPNTALFANYLALDEDGFVVVDEFLHSSIPGVFACGDVLKNSFGQAIVGSGQGCQAALSASRYLRMQK